jgi:hypothetical protein
MKQAKQYFDNHSSVDLLYFTSDDLAFFDEQNATNHARQLTDETITTLTRDEAERELEGITAGTEEDEAEYDPLDMPDAE